jgi:diguanylate cyclase (GGDEF)-like protein/PAS domain S-box-containing protein
MAQETGLHAAFRRLQESAADVMFHSRDGVLAWISPAVQTMLGWSAEELTGSTTSSLWHPDDVGVEAAMSASVRSGVSSSGLFRARQSDGTYRWVQALVLPYSTSDGSVGTVGSLRGADLLLPDQMVALTDNRPGSFTLPGVAGQLTPRAATSDINSESHAVLMALQASEARYRMLAENASDIVVQVDSSGAVVWVSESVTAVLGWPRDELIGTGAFTLLHEEDRPGPDQDIIAAISEARGVSNYRIRRSDGSWRWMCLSAPAVAAGDGSSRVIGIRDIHNEVAALTDLARAVGHDTLTGLPSRSATRQLIARLVDSPGGGEPLAVLCVGVDCLSDINDAFTQAGGDLVLAEIGRRLSDEADTLDVVGRGAGIDFLVVSPGVSTVADAEALAERLRQSARGRVEVGSAVVQASVSIGIALSTSHTSAEQLITQAHVAMRRAKSDGRDSISLSDPLHFADAQRRLSLDAEIDEGLSRSHFVPWFQPIVVLATGALAGYEALARWSTPDGRVREPIEFMTQLEASPRMADLDMTILEQSLDALARLPAGLHMAVNVSARTLARPGYARLIADVLDASPVTPSSVVLEITETSLLSDIALVAAAMRTVAETGARWYVDDFGTGYSSISHLRDLPVAGFKLDRSFTHGIGQGDRTSVRLAHGLVGLAHGLGLDTVAEGVETQEQEAVLDGQGWRLGQGWRFGRAAPVPTSPALPRPTSTTRDTL